MQRLVDDFGWKRDALLAEIAVKEGQIRDYEARIGKPFQHEAYRGELTDLRDKLKLGLSEHAPEGGESVAELAEKIKALRASNEVEAAPVRVGTRKAARAEVPVTQRIRERRAEVPVVEAAEEVKAEWEIPEVVKPEPVAPVEPPARVITMPVAAKPVEDHRQAVTKRRQGDGRQMSLF